MNRLVFEDDDVLQEALMMDSISDDDCIVRDTGPISSKPISTKQDMNESSVRQPQNKNVEEGSTNKGIEDKRDLETEDQCQNCLQVFKKDELRRHACEKKKRKSLILSFYKNQSFTSSLNVKNVRKSDIRNDTAKFDKRLSIDSNASEKFDKSSKHESKNIKDLDEKEQNLAIKTSKTPFFYECSVCFKHFTKKEINTHHCRDDSPCLTLRFSRCSSPVDIIDKNDKKLKRAKKSVSFEEIPFLDIKDSNYKKKTQVKHKRDTKISPFTEPKQPIKSQHFDNEKILKKVNPPILPEEKNKYDTKRKKSMKRKFSDLEKSTETVKELKTVKRKIDNQNNETTQPKNITSEDVGNGNAIVDMQTPNQKSTATNTDQPNNGEATSKNVNSDQSKTADPKSTPHIKVNPDEVDTTPNKKPITPIEESAEKSGSVVLHKTDLEQNKLKKRTRKPTKLIKESQRKIIENSDRLLKYDKITPQNTDKMMKKGEISSKNVSKIFSDNLGNKEAEVGKQNNETNQPKNVGDGNTIVGIESPNQKLTAKNTDQPNNEEATSKNVNSDQSKTADPKSTPHIKVNPDEIETTPNKKPIAPIEESVEKCGSVVLHKTDLEQDKLKKRIRKPTKQIVKFKRKIIKSSDRLLKHKITPQSTHKMIKRGEKSSKNVTSEKNKLFRLNKQKAPLEKEMAVLVTRNLKNKKAKTTQNEKVDSIGNKNSNSQKETKRKISESLEKKKDNQSDNLLKHDEMSDKMLINKSEKLSLNVSKNFSDNLGNKEAEVVTTRNKQNRSSENGNSNNEKEQGNKILKNVKANLTPNIESNDYKTERRILKKMKRPSIQKKYKCRLCDAKYTKIKNYKHICKNRVKKSKFKKNTRINVKKPDVILNNCKNNSQSKINITILARENVKIVTVSNNAKDYEVNQGKISNCTNSDQILKENDIEETTEQIITNISTNKCSTKTISQTEINKISEEKAFETEKVTVNVTGEAEPIILQHSNAVQNLDTTTKELSICEENSKIQDNNAISLKEPQKQNDNEKTDEKQVIHNNLNPTDVAKLSQNADHSYSMTDVDDQLVNNVNSEYIVATQDVEHNYSVTEKNMYNIFLCKIHHVNTKTAENDTIITETEKTTDGTKNDVAILRNDVESNITVPEIVGNEITIPDYQITTSESEITLPENVGSEVTITESVRSKMTESESEIILPENVGSEVTIPESVGIKITESESEILLPENVGSEVTIPESVESKIIQPESEITLPENVGSEVTITESVESKMTESESEITLPENVGSEVTIPESVGSKITEPESEITLPENGEIIITESEITVTTQNENTTSTQDIENSTNQIGNIDCEIFKSKENEIKIVTQNKELDKNELTLEDHIVSIDNVAQEIIIPASEEEITHEGSEMMSADVENHVTRQIKNDCFISIENVEQEVIITTENIVTDDVSIGNLGNEIVILTQKDKNVEENQNADNIVETIERVISMKIVEHTQTDENLENEIILTTLVEGNDNIASAQIKENIKPTYSESAGLINNEHHYENRESYTKISAENVEHHTRNKKSEKVSVESLENEVFVSNYIGQNDSNRNVRIDANVLTTYSKSSDLIEDVQPNDTCISKQDDMCSLKQTETNLSTKNVAFLDAVKDAQHDAKYIETSDSINDTNKSTQNDNVSVQNERNEIVEVTEANQDPISIIDISNDILVQNEVTENEHSILSRKSGQNDYIIPTNDEIETIIIISSESENKKNVVLTQNEKNETVIIISKQKEEIIADCNNTSNRIKEITAQDHQIENVVVKQSLTEKEDIKAKSKRKCLKCSKIFTTKDKLKTHNCTEIKTGKVSKLKFRNVKKLPNKSPNNLKYAVNVGEREKEDGTETQLAEILNQNDSQTKISETQQHSETHICDKNNEEKEDNTLESQLAAILNQDELQNKLAVKQDHSRISSANNTKNYEKNESPITNNQLLDILSKNVEDSKQNSTTSKCFRCSKEFTDRELTVHNCIENEKQSGIKTSVKIENHTNNSLVTDRNSVKIEINTTEVTEARQNSNTAENNILYVIEVKEISESKESISKTNSIRCFNCSEIYDKTHKCSNTKPGTENNISLEKPNINIQDISFNKKKNKYYFDAYILKTENGLYKCKICSKDYTARKNLVRHLHQHEKDYDTERFKCTSCPKTFQYKASLKSHELTHTGQTYPCSICDQSFSRKNNLYTHTKNLHNEGNDSCNKSEKEYARKKNPNIEIKTYTCDLCDKKYKQKHNLVDHFLYTHSKVKSYKCKYCDKKFGFRSTYLNHIINCANAKKQKIKDQLNEVDNKISKLSCKICLITFKTVSRLKKHEWRHENTHFYCNICQKKFNSKHYLQLHLTKHNELGLKREKFQCPQCKKTFFTKFGLNLHLNIHNDVKFSCPLCEKLFTTKLLLKTHERTHTGQNPFVCDNCKKAFNNRSNFNRHRKNKVCFFRPET